VRGKKAILRPAAGSIECTVNPEPVQHEERDWSRTREYFASIQDENGVDLTLIRENLR
jgi:hypothetical protein